MLFRSGFLSLLDEADATTTTRTRTLAPKSRSGQGVTPLTAGAGIQHGRDLRLCKRGGSTHGFAIKCVYILRRFVAGVSHCMRIDVSNRLEYPTNTVKLLEALHYLFIALAAAVLAVVAAFRVFS